jgi:hypothetical protein
MEITPISDLGMRMPEHGRIRLGVKDKTKQGRHAIDTFRFTSPDQQAIEQLAAIYGGTPRPWHDPRAAVMSPQFEVISNATELRIFLAQGGIIQWYERWSGGGCERRCDGVVCQMPRGEEMADVPCVCAQVGKLQCETYTRMTMILPDIVFGGGWRLETKGEHASQELPAMMALVSNLSQHGGMIEARLVLLKRQSSGGKKQFVVPSIRLINSPLELMAGAAEVTALASGNAVGMPALGPVPDDDIDLIPEAELVVIKPLKERLDELAAEHPVGPSLEMFTRAECITEIAPKIRALPLELLAVILRLVGSPVEDMSHEEVSDVIENLPPSVLKNVRKVLVDLEEGRARMHRNPDNSLVLRKVGM